MIYTLTVKLVTAMYFETECARVIEIEDTATLDDLHMAIQKAVKFDNDHLYDFYTARTWHGRKTMLTGDDSGGDWINEAPPDVKAQLPAGLASFFDSLRGPSNPFRISNIRPAQGEGGEDEEDATGATGKGKKVQSAKTAAAGATEDTEDDYDGPLRLKDVYPIPNRGKLFYLFDYGDSWTFEIKKARGEKPRQPGVKYPRVIEKVGPNPKQYG